jgi:hypothetical protein
MSSIKAEVSPWDDGDYIVGIRPVWACPWELAPVGPLVSHSEATVIAKWLEVAWPGLLSAIGKMGGPPYTEEVIKDLTEIVSNGDD